MYLHLSFNIICIVSATLLLEASQGRKIERPSFSKLNIQGCGRNIHMDNERKLPSHNNGIYKNLKESKVAKTQHEYIVGGQQSKDALWPWMIAIFLKMTNGEHVFACGGTLISNRYAISAAHCFRFPSGIVEPKNVVLKIGLNDRTSTNKNNMYEVEDVHFNDKFAPPVYYNDIALIKLKKKAADESGKIRPICLPTNIFGRSSLQHKTATAVGWGAHSYDGSESNRLYHVDVPITSNMYCNERYNKISAMKKSYPKGIISNILCAGETRGGKDACSGDSGGPLMMKDEEGRWTLTGIISGGYSCAEPGFPGIYTRVGSFLSWINDRME